MDCRALAKSVQNESDASLLEDIAAELEIAATWISALSVVDTSRAHEMRLPANRN